MILGVGIDIVEVSRIAEILQKYSGRFAQRIFTEDERAYCESMPDPALHYAARFAAKESFVKALGTGFSKGIAWKEICVQRLPSGKPVLQLTGQALLEMERLSVSHVHISLSHTHSHGCAVVVIEG